MAWRWQRRSDRDLPTGTHYHGVHSIPAENSRLAVEEPGVTGFAPTFNRLVDVIEVACMKTFARIDHAARSEVNTLGLATVYLKLKLPIAKGAVQVTTLPTESPRYEMGESAHHHHVLCNNCRRIYDILGCPVDFGRLALRGFTVDHHFVASNGRCRNGARREMGALR